MSKKREKQPDPFPFKVTWKYRDGGESSHSLPVTGAKVEFADGWTITISATELTVKSKAVWESYHLYRAEPRRATNLTIPLEKSA